MLPGKRLRQINVTDEVIYSVGRLCRRFDLFARKLRKEDPQPLQLITDAVKRAGRHIAGHPDQLAPMALGQFVGEPFE